MLFQTFFREKALARRSEREAVDARLQITAPHEWLLVSGLGAALLVLLAYGLLGRAERSLEIETVLVQPGERVDVVAGVSGVVVDVLAEVGDAVASGQAIARVRTAGADRWDAVLSRLLESLENAEGAPGPVAAEILGALAAPGSEAGQRVTEDPATRDIVASHDGELVTLALAVGRRVAAGELAARIRAESAGPLEALGFVAREDAMRLAPDMRAQVLVAVPGAGAPLLLPARVEEVSARVVSPPPWLTELGVEPPPRAHLLRATLTEPAPEAVSDGVQGALRIVLGHRSFVSLLFGNDGD